MTRLARILALTLMVSVISLFETVPALAIPPLPSSFYGTVKLNGANMPDGTTVRALIGGQVYATAFTQTYQGSSVYSIDVPGDNPDTAGVDGGREGETVQFEVGGTLAAETGVWHSGTNVNQDLTVSGSGPLPTPQVPPSPVPTQTAITVILPTATSKVSLPSPTSTQPVQPSPTLSVPAGSQPAPLSTVSIQPSATSPSSEDQEPGSPGNPWIVTTIILVIVVLILMALIGYLVSALRKKK